MSHEAFTLRIAAFFREHPMEWIDGRRLAEIGGAYGWRTRISDARRQYHMRIENRQRRIERHDGTFYKVSEYCFTESGKLF